VRAALIALAACGAPAAVAPRRDPPRPPPAVREEVPVDPIAALAPGGADRSWIAPGPLQLELGATPLQPAREDGAIEAAVIADRGSSLRVGVLLEHVRFAAWIDRARLYSIVVRDARVDVGGIVDFTRHTEVVLRAGARVRRLAHRSGATQIRYLGALEVEGWLRDDELSLAGPPRDPIGRIPTGRQVLTVLPGSVIRDEPRWSAHQLAVMANGYFLDTIAELDDAWVEVGYEDGDLEVHGFVSRHDPPGRVHRPREPELAPTPLAPNATIAGGTCLHAREGGEPIGYVVGDMPAEIEPGARAGWFAVSLDTPWGPIAFAAQGPTEGELVTCGP
jgi:hypothetical protein